MSSQLEQEVALVIYQATSRDTPSINYWQVLRTSREIVRRLLAGGISETAIRNTLVHSGGEDQPTVTDASECPSGAATGLPTA